MARLDDKEIDRMCRLPDGFSLRDMALEIREHRAVLARLESWAVQLDDNKPGSVGPFIAAELRNRIKGD